MKKKTADLGQKLARVDLYVTVIAFFWLIASALLFVVAAPQHMHAVTHHTPATRQAQVAPAIHGGHGVRLL